MSDQLERIFNPRAIAVIGASKSPGKRGYRTIEDLTKWGYEGEIYPVNPKYDEVMGLPCYASVTDIPDRVDLAFVAIPAPYVPDAIRECGDAGIAGAVINTAGFGEVGEENLEEELAAVADETGVRLIGPNIQGVDFVHQGVHLLGSTRTTPGHLGMLTQSGNMGVVFSVDAEDFGNVGFSYNIGVGNETDLEFHEYLRYLGDEDDTTGVVAYVEGMADGRAFLREARRVSREKPIVAFKAGQTAEGKESAKSHTASLAGDIDVADAAYRQAGVQRVDSIDLVVPVAAALTDCPIPEGSGVAVLTDGGGHATVLTDALEKAGLDTPELSTGTQETLQGMFELSPNVSNPVDVMGQFDHEKMWYDAARIILEDPAVDTLLITGAAFGYEECWGEEAELDVEPDVARKLAGLVDELGKPVVLNSMWEELDCSTALGILSENGVPVYERVDTAVAAIRALADYGEHLAHADEKSDFELGGGEPDGIVAEALEAGRERLSEHESKRLLADRGAPVAPFELAETAREAAAAADRIDGPVAMKIASPDIVHKTDAGGVELDVTDDVQPAFERITANARAHDPDADLQGVLVSPMLDAGVELILGVAHDPEVGPVITCGIGGVLVEAIDDAAFRALPLTEYDARRMIEEIEAQALLDGPRGLPPVDRDELVDLLVSVSELVEANPAIAELDLNPVMATADGLAIVDASVELDVE